MDRTTLGLAQNDLRREVVTSALPDRVLFALNRFVSWLDTFGETSLDQQNFYAGPVGGRAKSLYYRRRVVGTAAVAPMVFCEAFAPATRQLYHRTLRFPIADAHYAMGFGLMYEIGGNPAHFTRACHFLEALETTRSSGFENYCWGYPFDWVTRNGVIATGTPLITTTP